MNGTFEEALKNALSESSRYKLEHYEAVLPYMVEDLSYFAKSDEAKDMILNYISKGENFSSSEFLAANAKAFEGKTVSHGLYAYSTKGFTIENSAGMTMNEVIRDHLSTITNNNIELATASSQYTIGPIGIFGKAKDVKSAYHEDLWSTIEDGSRNAGKGEYNVLGNLQGKFDSYRQLKQKIKAGKSTGQWKQPYKHNEIIATIEPETLWVKENYFKENQDFVTSLMEEHGITKLDVIHSENFENTAGAQIDHLTYDDLISIKSTNVEQPKLTESDSIKIESAKPTPKSEVPKPKIETPKPDVKDIKTPNLKPKTINNTAKKALNTKGIGFAIAAGAVAVGAVGAVIHNDNEKKKEKKHKENIEQQHSNEINYDNDLTYANSISKFSKGHYAYSLQR